MQQSVVGKPENTVLTTEQAAALLSELRKMRHDVNNHLATIMAAAELIQHRPDMAPRMLESLSAKPAAIAAAIKAFSMEMEKAIGPKKSE